MKTFTSLLLAALIGFTAQNPVHGEYGVDVSWPMQYHPPLRSHPGLEHQQKKYEAFLEGCKSFYKDAADRCDHWEKERIAMNLRQPQSVVNYTSNGYLKIKAPESAMALLIPYWKENRYRNKTENWAKGYTITNHWESPSVMVSVEDETLVGGGKVLKSQVWNAVKEVIEEWTGQEQVPCSLYGIRVYTEGSILAPHVDRLPLVGSAIINVAQDVDSPWILEVVDRKGNAINVTMEPGDMVLYESHSLLHGRPFPLNGRFVANIFVHFEPSGRPLDRKNDTTYFETVDFSLPPYLIRGSPEQPMWEMENPNGWKMPESADDDPDVAHSAAMQGDIIQLTRLAKMDEKLIHYKDENGWRPFHEACRTGHKDVIDFLLRHGADINELTNLGDSCLGLAIKYLSVNHPVVAHLKSLGAKEAVSTPLADPYVAHKAAIVGDVTGLSKLAEEDGDIIHRKDENGWRPLHEAVRMGHKHVIEFLVERGADVNERTHQGESPLHLGRQFLEPEHPVLIYLESLGAEDLEPEL